MYASMGDQVSVAELAPAKPQLPPGVSADFGGRSKAAGLTPEAAAAEVAKIKAGGVDPTPDEEAAAVAKAAGKAEKVEAIKKELAAMAPVLDLAPKIVEAKKALALLTAQKQLAALKKKARAANAEIDASNVEPKAYVLAVTPAEAQKGVADELRTIGVKSFLAAVEKAEPGDIAPHVAAGSFAALNSAALGVAGVVALDRSAVDVLGAAGAAQVLARRLRLKLSPEEHPAALEAVTAHHLAHTDSKAEGVLKQVAELQAIAAVPLPDVVGSDQLLAGAEAHQKRAQALADANRALGQALGEFEAGAALVAAMGAPLRKSVQVSLGSASLDIAVKQVRALGLVPGDYELSREGGNVFLQVSSPIRSTAKACTAWLATWRSRAVPTGPTWPPQSGLAWRSRSPPSSPPRRTSMLPSGLTLAPAQLTVILRPIFSLTFSRRPFFRRSIKTAPVRTVLLSMPSRPTRSTGPSSSARSSCSRPSRSWRTRTSRHSAARARRSTRRPSSLTTWLKRRCTARCLPIPRAPSPTSKSGN